METDNEATRATVQGRGWLRCLPSSVKTCLVISTIYFIVREFDALQDVTLLRNHFGPRYGLVLMILLPWLICIRSLALAHRVAERQGMSSELRGVMLFLAAIPVYSYLLLDVGTRVANDLSRLR